MWSGQQQKALDTVGRWLKNKDKPFFQLAGFAGTGKTTLAKHLAGQADGLVYFAAYTGKAAHVLMKAGAQNVSTIHKLIYQPKDRSQQRLKELQAERAKLMTRDPVPRDLVGKVEKAIDVERRNLTRPMFQLNSESPLTAAGLVIVDEYSMIDQQMGEDLLSFGCPVLALGDPGQLPPVNGKPYFSSEPDILLTEIHRQAEDNPIIWLSKQVREGRDLKPGDYGNSRVVPYRQIAPDALRDRVLKTDQLLVGKNKTRNSSNSRARELMGRSSIYPVMGDKLVCLRNNHDLGILNGQTWEAVTDAVAAVSEDYLTMRIKSDDGQKLDVYAHARTFAGKPIEYWDRKNAEEFDYGYALTVHKSQGSQWSDVLLFDEWFMRDRSKWLYTAITRAAERIDIIQM